MCNVVIYDTGCFYECKRYYKDKRCTILHREDGPAVEWKSGTKEWWVNGRLHRINGPAIEYNLGRNHFCINGQYYSEKNYWATIKLGAFV